MSDKPPYCVTEQTEDGSYEENQKTVYINRLQNANIIDVWAHNFYNEMERLTFFSKKFNVIAFDTQFPSIQQYNSNQNSSIYKEKQSIYSEEYRKYIKLTKNVDQTSLIQLGICLADEEGNVPVENFCWQFNFKFEGDIDLIAPQSGELLKKSGINFDKLKSDGINYKVFTHQFIKSGILLNTVNKWIVFHGGFDFSYLLKLIRNQPLPKYVEDFYKSIKIYFPQKYDLKCLIQKDKQMKRMGLSRLAQFIKCRRVGQQHQAGSDSLLTLQCYFRLKFDYEKVFQNVFEIKNQIFGIGFLPQQKRYFVSSKKEQLSNYYDQTMDYSNFYQQPYQELQYLYPKITPQNQFYEGKNYYYQFNNHNVKDHQQLHNQSHIQLHYPYQFKQYEKNHEKPYELHYYQKSKKQ